MKKKLFLSLGLLGAITVLATGVQKKAQALYLTSEESAKLQQLQQKDPNSLTFSKQPWWVITRSSKANWISQNQRLTAQYNSLLAIMKGLARDAQDNPIDSQLSAYNRAVDAATEGAGDYKQCLRNLFSDRAEAAIAIYSGRCKQVPVHSVIESLVDISSKSHLMSVNEIQDKIDQLESLIAKLGRGNREIKAALDPKAATSACHYYLNNRHAQATLQEMIKNTPWMLR